MIRIILQQTILRAPQLLITLNFSDDQFDVVTLWYVIEHLLDPRATIRECYRILKPGGLLVLSQQNFQSIQAKLFGPRWLILDPPRHIFQFSPSNLTTLTAQEGFVEHHVANSSIEMGPFTILQSMLNFLLGNDNYLFKFLKNRNLRGQNNELKLKFISKAAISILLLPILVPISLAVYFLLLMFGSGDIFTIYARKQK